MDPTKQYHGLLQRFEVFCRDVLEPAVFPVTHPLEAAAWQCAEPVPFAEAMGATYSPVRPGWEWGPVWSTCWFRVRGEVPQSMSGRTVVLRFSTDTEALVWIPTPGTPSNGTPIHGLDANRDAVRLLEPAGGGEKIDLYVEAACNHLFGDRGLQWDPPEIHRRWSSRTPGRLDRCELAVLDETVWRLKWVYTFALQLARELPSDSARSRQLFGALRRCSNAIPDDRVAQTARKALEELESAVRVHAGGGASLCHAIGHAHIDTAWLWPIRETRRKCIRTFSTALRNMERFPEYTFLCSQAQQYAWLEETSPEL
ncbi:MAG: alpha-mannosidase, partial [Phycisphaerales bacterium]